MTVECVTLETNHLFSANPLAEQHRLRYRSIITRQDWKVPSIRDMEYDEYDNPSATYLVWRNVSGVAQGVSRLYPTDRPFMLSEKFPHMVNYSELPTGRHVWEGSRFCIDHTIDKEQRLAIAQELVLAYLEFGIDQGIHQFVGIMYPIYWSNLFIKNGWDPVWLGDVAITPDGKKARAGLVNVSEEVLEQVRAITGIHEKIISYGYTEGEKHVQAA